MSFCVANGVVFKEKDANVSSFIFNDFLVVTKTIWFGYGGIPLFNENIRELEKELKELNKDLPELLKDKRELFRLTKRMLNKNKFYRSGLITFRLFVSENKIDTLITSVAFENFDFPINEQGLLVDFADVCKTDMGSSAFMANAIWSCSKAKFNNNVAYGSIIQNSKDCVCEGLASNIFMVKDKVVYTPSLTTGCYEDVFRSVVFDLASKHDVDIVEASDIAKEQLLLMDEVFFVSERYGIQWALGIGERRYVHGFSDFLYVEINKYLKEKVEKPVFN